MYSDLTCYLKKGNFYKCGRTTYIVGQSVPFIANVWVCEVTKEGDLGDIEAIYYRQDEKWKISYRRIVIKDKYKEQLQELFSHNYSDFIEKQRKYGLPSVYEYLECGQINSVKKYAISKKDKAPNKYMMWLHEHCKYDYKNNMLIFYINNFCVGYKSDAELYEMYLLHKKTNQKIKIKNQTNEKRKQNS